MCGIYVALLAAVVFLIYSDVTFAAQTNPTTIQSAETTPSHFISRNNQKRVLRTSDNIAEFSAMNEERQWYEFSKRRAKENLKFRFWFKTGKRPEDIYRKFFNTSMDTRAVAADPNFGIFSRYAKYYEGHKKKESWLRSWIFSTDQ
ncbi:hypothetical protein JG687_00007841 [Phytophthora cactorum]|uniref:RxLR effector protein n=2 Tax=Phytophthora cactorum TaxID=29920 RepID=A0A329RQE9_9STRA|nr:hypothetical protein GQ600_5836 [Phytophthora cactorum]KAG6961120.1 hypothetical protein JG687_00007841 [Phytophthora cactorum]RAW25388.1 hypothetical protein PC110_g18196 [Phytophthora cactorum]